MARQQGKDYVPLNVKTYKEGFLRLQGWICFSGLAFLTAGLLVLYELLIINVEDQDFRDMLFDYRITRPGISHQHKYFANAMYCCHHDPQVLKYTCPDDQDYNNIFYSGPSCPPVVQFTCPDLASDKCNTLRSAVYPAAGLDAATGIISDCRTAGQILLRAKAGTSYKLTAFYKGSQMPQQLTVDPNSIDQAEVDAYFDGIRSRQGDPMFWLPREPLSRAVRIDGQQAILPPFLEAEGSDKWGAFGWPWELWPWPPGAGCSRTGVPPVLHLQGQQKLTFSSAEKDLHKPQPLFKVSVYNNNLLVPQYRIAVVDIPNSASATRATTAAAAARAEVNDPGNTTVVVQALTGIDIRVGMLAQLGACDAWQIHKPGFIKTYDHEIWQGPAQDLLTLAQPITAGTQAINITLRDVTQPEPLALPHYAGELYIYVALVLGGIWMFATVPLIVMFGVVLINVQRNKGLPIFLYRYMRKYRGW